MYELAYNNFFHFLENRSKTIHATLSTLLGTGIGYLDYLTGDFDFVLFYVIPIFLATWFIGKWAGITTSILSCTTSFGINLPSILAKTSPINMVWDFALDMTFFLFLTFLFRMLWHKFDEVNKLALRDHLTHALNRRSLDEVAEYQFLASKRHHRPFSVAFFDLDNFKMVNDQLGHNIGDRLLCRVVDVMTTLIRGTDLVARLGGDEFVVVCPESDETQSQKVIERLRRALLEAMKKEGWPVTFSIGLVTDYGVTSSWDEILQRADLLMYRVKSAKKDGILHEVIRGPYINPQNVRLAGN
ncbi:GGDEF domain-containing protein [Geopsychrobacter electrodiphilus]|uniref:GGDEF domain-containing protein n=1 Tax=Geopsychrobacter electrodiphilus TaxID=225196 RepID=UPI000371E6F3|nr:GGDEF domain-containing protein [Geopsychrobacter electrodiphilus]